MSVERRKRAVELVPDDDEEGDGGAEAVDDHAKGREAPAPRAARAGHGLLGRDGVDRSGSVYALPRSCLARENSTVVSCLVVR